MNTKLPKNIDDNDSLGRAIFSSNDTRKAKNSKIRHNVFMENKPEATISVDRFDFCPQEELINIQDQNAKKRSTEGTRRSFYGWARLKAINARKEERKVESNTVPENPYHAEIILPEPHTKDHQIDHAHELAYYSNWWPR